MPAWRSRASCEEILDCPHYEDILQFRHGELFAEQEGEQTQARRVGDNF